MWVHLHRLDTAKCIIVNALHRNACAAKLTETETPARLVEETLFPTDEQQRFHKLNPAQPSIPKRATMGHQRAGTQRQQEQSRSVHSPFFLGNLTDHETKKYQVLFCLVRLIVSCQE